MNVVCQSLPPNYCVQPIYCVDTFIIVLVPAGPKWTFHSLKAKQSNHDKQAVLTEPHSDSNVGDLPYINSLCS